MRQLINFLKNTATDETGTNMVEYGLIIALLACGLAGAAISLGNGVKASLTGSSKQIAAALPTANTPGAPAPK
jgi:Flp pilus assembly pilin Flp